MRPRAQGRLAALPVLLGAALLGLLPSLGPAPRAAGGSDYDLFRGLAGAPAIEVVCADPSIAAAVDRAIAITRSEVPQALVRVTPEDSRPDLPRVVVGSLEEPWVRALAARVGLVLELPDRAERESDPERASGDEKAPEEGGGQEHGDGADAQDGAAVQDAGGDDDAGGEVDDGDEVDRDDAEVDGSGDAEVDAAGGEADAAGGEVEGDDDEVDGDRAGDETGPAEPDPPTAEPAFGAEAAVDPGGADEGEAPAEDAAEAGAPRLVLSLGGGVYAHDGDVLIATLADPDRPGLPLTLHLSNRPAVLAAELCDVAPRWRPGAEVRRDGLPLLVVDLRRTGAPRWETAVELDERRRAARGPSLHPAAGMVVRLTPGVERRRAQDLARLAAAARAAVAFTFAAPPPTLELHLVGRLDEMRELYGVRGLSHAPPSAPWSAFALCAPGLPHDGGAAAARATAIAVLGPPSEPWLYDGIGEAFAETWFGRPRDLWIASLQRAGRTPTAAELAAPDAAAWTSPHVLSPLRGELVRVLLDLRGPDAIARAWRGQEPLALDDEVERELSARLERAAETHADRLDRVREARREGLRERGWLGGVHLVPGAPDGAADLARPGLAKSLEAARDAGANAVALSPLAWLEARPRLRPGEPRASWPDASPDDLEIAHAVHVARELGLGSMLAPQVILTPGGTWAASQVLGGQTELEGFFAGYARALGHYALLAELIGVDVLCIGNDLAMVTSTRELPIDDARTRAHKERLRAGWDGLLGRVRASFGGLLTYAAQVAPELERVEFWDELDLVGVELFLPVPPPSRPHLVAAGAERVAEELRHALEVARGFDRPLLVVQAGYPSHDLAHEEPLLARGPVDLELQARLYEVLDAGLRKAAEEEEGEISGVFLWRWDPDPQAGGSSDPSHTPQRKPAASVLSSLLRR